MKAAIRLAEGRRVLGLRVEVESIRYLVPLTRAKFSGGFSRSDF